MSLLTALFTAFHIVAANCLTCLQHPLGHLYQGATCETSQWCYTLFYEIQNKYKRGCATDIGKGSNAPPHWAWRCEDYMKQGHRVQKGYELIQGKIWCCRLNNCNVKNLKRGSVMDLEIFPSEITTPFLGRLSNQTIRTKVSDTLQKLKETTMISSGNLLLQSVPHESYNQEHDFTINKFTGAINATNEDRGRNTTADELRMISKLNKENPKKTAAPRSSGFLRTTVNKERPIQLLNPGNIYTAKYTALENTTEYETIMSTATELSLIQERMETQVAKPSNLRIIEPLNYTENFENDEQKTLRASHNACGKISVNSQTLIAIAVFCLKPRNK